ncbi:MAG: DMT family transporter [Chloroflexota bacterium]
MTRPKAILQTLGILVLVSLGHVLAKFALTDIAPFTLAWVSVGIGMMALGTYTFVIRREPIPRGLGRQVWIYIILIGILNFAVARIVFTLSLERLTATTNIYLLNFVGFVTMGMSIFILKETPTIFQIIGAGVAFAGLRVFFDELPSSYELVGVIFVVIGVIAIGYTNNIARKVAIITDMKLSNNVLSSLAILIGGTIAVLSGIIFDWPPRIVGWRTWGIALYMGIVTTAFTMTVWNYILRTLRSYEASILGASTVIWTALLAIPILGEQLSFNEVIGIILMIVGLSLVQVRQGQISQLWQRLSQSA